MMKVRILLVDDHKMVREGLRLLLEKDEEMEVVGEASEGRVALDQVRELSPDVVIMDVAMPNLNGIEATREILAERPATKVVMLSMHSDKRFVINSLKCGARGYLLKNSAFVELLDAIRTVSRGQIFLSPSISGIIIEDYVHRLSKPEPKEAKSLTAREREVLQLLAEGNVTKEIAEKLHISVKTVETHRLQIMDKLEMHTIAELTKYAIREGLTSLTH
jgi:DNA-binding NarL/FixJ family response regulator